MDSLRALLARVETPNREEHHVGSRKRVAVHSTGEREHSLGPLRITV